MLAVMFLDQLGAAGGAQRIGLPYFRAEVDHTRAELLPEIDGMEL